MKYYLRFGFSNKSKSLLPIYRCGYNPNESTSYVPWGGKSMNAYTCKFGWPLPVVPIARLIDLINKRFNVKFKLSKEIDFDGEDSVPNWDSNNWYKEVTKEEYESDYNSTIADAIADSSNSKVFDIGVIPCVNAQISDDQKENNQVFANDLVSIGTFCNTTNAYAFKGVYRDDFTLAISKGSGSVIMPRYNFQCYEVTGNVNVYIKYAFIQDKLDTETGYVVQQVKDLQMTFRQDQGYNKGEELGSVKGIFLGTKTVNNVVMAVISFNMESQYGVESVKLENLAYGEEKPLSAGIPQNGVFITFDSSEATISPSNITIVSTNLKFDPYFNEGGRPHLMNPVTCLPEISCFEFMKSLYYVEGAYPKLNNDGTIGIMYITDIKKNIESKNVYDWSKKLIDNSIVELSPNTTYAQNNYVMSNSDDEKDDETINDEGFKNYKIDLKIDNKNLKESNTIVKVPFESPYVKNVSFQAYSTGGTTNYWNIEEVYRKNAFSVSAKETKPFIGFLSYSIHSQETVRNEHYIGNLGAHYTLTFEPWDSFENNKEYKYLGEILKCNTIIKANFNLDIVELATIDYTKPIYIERFNSYFAIINIDWKSADGISEVELIKTPY